MKRLFLSLIILMLIQLISAQKVENKSIVIAYLNADKMFDIVNDEGAYDDLYTASGEKFWGEQRYNDKLDSLEELVLTINGKDLPEIFVISEIENKEVVSDFLKRKSLKKMKYRAYFKGQPEGKSYVILSTLRLEEEHTADIDIVSTSNDGISASISYSTFILPDGNKYHLFINNWSGRSDGPGGSEAARMNCAVALRKEIDIILNFERDARIIILGTFNDEPTNKSILTMLNASNKRKNLHYRDLYNPFYDLHNRDNKGTVEINGSLQMYDFIIISPRLLKKNMGYSCGFVPGEIGGSSPALPVPTFRANEYTGGAGGHLPVSIRLSRDLEKQ